MHSTDTCNHKQGSSFVEYFWKSIGDTDNSFQIVSPHPTPASKQTTLAVRLNTISDKTLILQWKTFFLHAVISAGTGDYAQSVQSLGFLFTG